MRAFSIKHSLRYFRDEILSVMSSYLELLPPIHFLVYSVQTGRASQEWTWVQEGQLEDEG
jgi:hypothetical protein